MFFFHNPGALPQALMLNVAPSALRGGATVLCSVRHSVPWVSRGAS